jgi:hypothetical protein
VADVARAYRLLLDVEPAAALAHRECRLRRGVSIRGCSTIC